MKKASEENMNLKNKLESNVKVQQDLEEKNELLTKTIKNLRGLTASLMKDTSTGKVKDKRINKVFQQIEFKNILIDSEPPLD